MPRLIPQTPARRRALFGVLGVLALMLGLAAAWHWTPLKQIAEPGMLSYWLNEAEDEPWLPLIVLFHAVASLMMFPNTVLCFAIILTLGPVLGTFYAYSGSVAAALAGYVAGRLGGKHVEKLRIQSVQRVSKQLRQDSFMQVLVLRLLPVVPFMVLNIVAGAARARLIPFLAATVVGISPYVLAFAAFGRQARRLLSDPSPTDAAITAAVLVLAAFVLWQVRAFAAARAR